MKFLTFTSALIVGAQALQPTLKAVSDSCSIDVSAFGQHGYTDGPWYPLLVYYWDAGSSPVLIGADSTVGYGSCSQEYMADYCGTCFYGMEAVSSSSQHSVLYSCIDVEGEGQQESVWFLAREDHALGSLEMGEWLDLILPETEQVFPMDRLTRLAVTRPTDECMFRLD